MQQYKDLLRNILQNGVNSDDRTGVGTLSVFGHQMRFDLKKGFPLVTIKDTWFKGLAVELEWFLRGITNVKWLQERGVHIWDEWADEETGELGKVYGYQWRHWETVNWAREADNGSGGYVGVVDQIKTLIDRIKTNPNCRRLIVTAWNPGQLNQMALPPCHMFFQCWVRNGKLKLQMYQRSVDSFLGLPFNIASYALLTHIIAKVCNLEADEFIWTGGDTHLYKNHLTQVETILDRDPIPLPTLQLSDDIKEINDFKWDMCKVVGYKHHGKVKAPIAV